MNRRNLRETVALAGIIAPFVYLAMRQRSLPARFPIHFDLHGNANGFGSPATLFLLPVIAACVYVVLLLLQRAPGSFNLPVPSGSPARACYETMTTELIAWMRLEIAWTFAVTTGVIVRLAETGRPPMDPLLLTLLPLLVIATVVGFLLAMRRRCGVQRP